MPGPRFIHRLTGLFLLTVFLAPLFPLQAASMPSYPRVWGGQMKAAATSPLFWGVAGGGALLSAGIHHFTNWDRRWQKMAYHRNRGNWVTTGDFLQYTPLAYGAWYWSRGREATTLAYTDGWLQAGLWTLLLKAIVNQKRPRGSGLGWPSGHTSVTASGLGVSLGLRDYPAAIVHGVSTLFTAYSRTVGGKPTGSRRIKAYHYFTQVLAGIFVGGGIGYMVGRYYQKNFPASRPGYSPAPASSRVSGPAGLKRQEWVSTTRLGAWSW